MVGIFSLLDVMLSIPMESALKLLTVPDAVAAALLRREGVLGDLLTLAEACRIERRRRFPQGGRDTAPEQPADQHGPPASPGLGRPDDRVNCPAARLHGAAGGNARLDGCQPPGARPRCSGIAPPRQDSA